jgi:hypothetical protein
LFKHFADTGAKVGRSRVCRPIEQEGLHAGPQFGGCGIQRPYGVQFFQETALLGNGSAASRANPEMRLESCQFVGAQLIIYVEIGLNYIKVARLHVILP